MGCYGPRVEGSNGLMIPPDETPPEEPAEAPPPAAEGAPDPPQREATRRFAPPEHPATQRFAADSGADHGPGATRRFAPEAAPEPAPEPAPRAYEVGAEIDDFLLLDRLGAGAFAEVFLAHQTSLHRTVALKISETESEEAQTLAQLDHPNIVRVYDQRGLSDRKGSLLYMEYVPGGTLEHAIAQMRGLPPEERSGKALLGVIDEVLARRSVEPPLDSLLRMQLEEASWPEAVCLLGEHLAQALAYAHGRGVLHRDVKPANVLLAATGRAKLADFNISWSSDVGDGGAEAYLGGSLPYMSPEQIRAVSPFEEGRAEDLDGRSDIYSLGLVLWELLVGASPFGDLPPGEDWEALFRHLLATRQDGVPFDALSALPKDTPPMLVETLRACLHPDRQQRPESGAELARRFSLCLDPEIRGLLTSCPYPWAKWIRKIPILTLPFVALVPNAILSALAITYNVHAVVPEDQMDSFNEQLMVINGIGFPLGIGLMLLLTWPIHKAVRKRERGEELADEERRGARRWALRLGGGLTAIIFPLWLLGGLAFPLWRESHVGGGDVEEYFHFTLSNGLFGLLSAMLCFFVINYVVLRALMCRLVELGEVDAGGVAQIGRLIRNIPLYFAGCTSVPLLSVIVLSLWPEAMREAFLALGIMGATGFALAYSLSTLIRRDLRALQRALDPQLRSPGAAWGRPETGA